RTGTRKCYEQVSSELAQNRLFATSEQCGAGAGTSEILARTKRVRQAVGEAERAAEIRAARWTAIRQRPCRAYGHRVEQGAQRYGREVQGAARVLLAVCTRLRHARLAGGKRRRKQSEGRSLRSFAARAAPALRHACACQRRRSGSSVQTTGRPRRLA